MGFDCGPFIILVSSKFKTSQKRVFFLEEFPAHRVLAQTIYLCLTQQLGVMFKEAPFLFIYQTKLAEYFIQINAAEKFGKQVKDAIPLEKLFRWFFFHLYFDGRSEHRPNQIFFRYNNRIFMYIHPKCEPNFSPKVLTLITKKEYPFIFETLKQTDEEVLIPELPYAFRIQLYRFYDMLIKFFPLAKVEGTEDEALRKAFYMKYDLIYDPQENEANYVLEYLVNLRDFLDPDELFL